MATNKKAIRFLKTALKFIITAVALYFVFTRIEFSEVVSLYRKSNFLFIIVAVIFFTTSKLIAALRLNIFFGKAGLDISNKINIKLYLLGMFYNLFLPGGIGGDAYKIYLLQKNYKTGTGKLFGAVLTDRFSGMAVLVILALILFAFPGIPIDYHRWSLAVIPLVIIGFYFFMRWFYPHFLGIYPITMLYSFGVQLTQLICVCLISLALGNTDFMLFYLLIFLISSIVAVLPVSIGGMGLRELSFLYGAEFLGIDVNLAIAISLMFYLITALVSLGGLYFVIRPVKM